MSTDRAREIDREECSVCGAEVRGHVWSCNHPFNDPSVTGRPQERTPTVIRRYVALDAVVQWLRHVDRLSEIPGASSSMPKFNPLWDAANALEVEFGSVVPQPEQPA